MSQAKRFLRPATIIWAVVLVGGFIALGATQLLMVSTKSSPVFQPVAPSIGASPTTASPSSADSK